MATSQPPAAVTDPPDARSFPLHRLLPRLAARGPLRVWEGVGAQSGGAVARLNVGLFQPYLVTHPDHVQRVLRDRPDNYPRVTSGPMWKQLARLVGEGIAGEGPQWRASRAILQPAFGSRRVLQLADQMAAAVTGAVDDLGQTGPDRPVDAAAAMQRIVHRVINTVFFGGRIPDEDGDRLGHAITTALRSVTWRILMPGVPEWVPLPGDRAFRHARRTVDQILGRIVAEARHRPSAGQDVLSLLLAGQGANGRSLTVRQVRDDVVSMFVAGSESTVNTLTWLWVALETHPRMAARMGEEIDQVVGNQPVHAGHLRQLRYTRMVIEELLRLYSVAWIVPRTAAADDILGGTRIPAGSTVVLSPYLTHRLATVWEDPLRFDPDRFAPERARRRHRCAYIPFGMGEHGCLGQHVFTTEAQLVAVAMLRRFRPRLCTRLPVQPKAGLTVQPRHRVLLRLLPR